MLPATCMKRMNCESRRQLPEPAQRICVPVRQPSAFGRVTIPRSRHSGKLWPQFEFKSNRSGAYQDWEPWFAIMITFIAFLVEIVLTTFKCRRVQQHAEP